MTRRQMLIRREECPFYVVYDIYDSRGECHRGKGIFQLGRLPSEDADLDAQEIIRRVPQRKGKREKR